MGIVRLCRRDIPAEANVSIGEHANSAEIGNEAYTFRCLKCSVVNPLLRYSYCRTSQEEVECEWL